MKLYKVRIKFEGALLFKVRAQNKKMAEQYARTGEAPDHAELEQVEQESHDMTDLISCDEVVEEEDSSECHGCGRKGINCICDDAYDSRLD